jgi:hypothetical protein
MGVGHCCQLLPPDQLKNSAANIKTIRAIPHYAIVTDFISFYKEFWLTIIERSRVNPWFEHSMSEKHFCSCVKKTHSEKFGTLSAIFFLNM